jgi:hypothetical protein
MLHFTSGMRQYPSTEKQVLTTVSVALTCQLHVPHIFIRKFVVVDDEAVHGVEEGLVFAGFDHVDTTVAHTRA